MARKHYSSYVVKRTADIIVAYVEIGVKLEKLLTCQLSPAIVQNIPARSYWVSWKFDLANTLAKTRIKADVQMQQLEICLKSKVITPLMRVGFEQKFYVRGYDYFFEYS